MDETPRHDRATPALLAVVHAAERFGLTEDEVLQAVGEELDETQSDPPAAWSVDELAAALAGRILSKQRSIQVERHRAARDEL